MSAAKVCALAVVMCTAVACVSGASQYTAVGIDFGAETSSVAVIRDGSGASVVAAEPTYVSFTEQPTAKAAAAGQPLPFLTNVGRNAKATLATAPENTVYGFGALLGRAYDHPAVAALKASGVKYSVQKTADNQPAVQLTVSKQKVAFSAEQLTAMVLQRLKATAEAVLGGRVKVVVIAVPAAYDDAQREALERAAKTSGFTTVTVVSDADAAAHAQSAVGAGVATEDAAAIGAVLRANPSFDPKAPADHDDL